MVGFLKACLLVTITGSFFSCISSTEQNRGKSRKQFVVDRRRSDVVSGDKIFLPEKTEISPELPNWTNELLYLLENRAIYRNSVDWPTERQALIVAYKELAEQAKADQGKDEKSFRERIRTLIQRAGSRHSFFMSRHDLESFHQYEVKVDKSTLENLTFHLLDDHLGLFSIGGYSGTDPLHDDELIKAAAHIIHQAESKHCKGLIIDLTSNGGGNMHPPLASLSPILEDGDLGYFFYPNEKEKFAWRHNHGKIEIKIHNEVYLMAENKYHFQSTLRGLPIAVLISDHTASSGEFLALSLASQKNTKTFGQKTFGLPTGNNSMFLSDGSMLILTEALSVDTKGVTHDGPLSPDVTTETKTESINKAVQWIKSYERN